ncbi:hypothetical protein PP301_gp117 [Gordonia phage GMA2]|uniref:Nuclease associated modular domain-containing protein n=1 Tax=Gordonia phage GMA2 TaxID=1647283 RepID=A0A0K0N6Z3_9CAUD|nr:hypothetical protein PP301_gp117 [Gordonia phage GMA2]AKJ72605.1 hypothetical protein GMA2_67 [Gordonia phage GMA2]
MAHTGHRTPLYDWMRKHSRVYVVVVEDCEDAESLDLAEVKWIAILRNRDGLLNVLDGGQGSRGYRWTDEQKAALSATMRGKMTGKKFSKEHKEKLSQAAKNRPRRQHTEESKARMREAKRTAGWRPSEEQKQHLREVNTGKQHSTATKALLSEKAKARGKTKDHQDSISKAVRRRARCDICSMESNVTALGRHKTATGHSWTRLDD